MRGVIILLIMVIFFLSGFVFGMQKDQQDSIVEEAPVAEEVSIGEEVEPVVSEVNEMETNVYEIEDGQYSITNKAASILEAVVKNIFDLIVGIMYEVSKLFF